MTFGMLTAPHKGSSLSTRKWAAARTYIPNRCNPSDFRINPYKPSVFQINRCKPSVFQINRCNPSVFQINHCNPDSVNRSTTLLFIPDLLFNQILFPIYSTVTILLFPIYKIVTPVPNLPNCYNPILLLPTYRNVTTLMLPIITIVSIILFPNYRIVTTRSQFIKLLQCSSQICRSGSN